MSKALPGTHLCAVHQGNHSHYAPHNCEICKLSEEVKTLKGELELWQNPNRSVIREMAALVAENKRLAAEVKTLRETMYDILHGLEGARIWGGMEWTYNPLHPIKYLPLRDKARAAIKWSDYEPN